MDDDDLRCSSWTRSHEVDPIGTAGSYQGFLLVEWPLPWPRDVGDIPELSEVVATARRAGTRVQAVVPGKDGEFYVALYGWNPERGTFDGFEVRAPSDAASQALGLLSGERPDEGRYIDAVDVLVCGHGRRDRCCGSMGTALEAELRAGEPIAPDVRVRRTSHTGGHRFAPTAIVLPQGTVWGYLDEAALRSVVLRSGPFEENAARYRGCAGLSSPAVQALERAVLGVVGWPLLDWARAGEDHDDGTVSLLAVTPDGDSRNWRGRVTTRRVLPVPPCGRQVDEAEKTEAELAVEEFEELVVPADLEARPESDGADRPGATRCAGEAPG